MSAPKIFNIPAGRPFAKILAASLLRDYEGREQELSDVLILLPTRRACRVLQDAFLQLKGQKPLILPRLQPIGDLDEEELSLSLMGHEEQWSLPPALSPLRRQILLAKLVQKLQPDNCHLVQQKNQNPNQRHNHLNQTKNLKNLLMIKVQKTHLKYLVFLYGSINDGLLWSNYSVN